MYKVAFLVAGLAIGLFSAVFYFSHSTGDAPIVTSTVMEAQPAVSGKLSAITNKPTAKPAEQPRQKKLRISLAYLLKNKAEIVKLNPGLNLNSLDPGSEQFAKIRLPSNTHLIALKDANCAPSALNGIGAVQSGHLEEATDRTRSPSLVSFSTEQETTIGDLGKNIEENSCVLGVFANGSIDSVRLPAGTKDISSLIPQESAAALQVFDYQNLINQGRSMIIESAKNGDPQRVQVYMVGSTYEHVGLATGADPTQAVPVTGLPVPSYAAQIYALPMPQGDPSEQIANLNNSIIYAISNGANFILVPFIDPSAIAPSTQYAINHNAKVVIVPPDASIPAGRTPASGP